MRPNMSYRQLSIITLGGLFNFHRHICLIGPISSAHGLYDKLPPAVFQLKFLLHILKNKSLVIKNKNKKILIFIQD